MTTSARKENRWRRQLKQAADAEADRRRELEILSLARAPRAPIIPPPNHSRRQVRAWMRRNAHEYETATQLAEAANAALRLPLGSLDDETHWIWDEAADAIG